MNELSDEYLRNYLRKHYPESEISRIRNQPTSSITRFLGSQDFSFFCKYYLPHYFSKQYSPMHHYLMDIIQDLPNREDGEKISTASPRSSAKSTVVITGQVLWRICYGLSRYILLIKDTYDQAGLDLLGIAEEIESNELIKRDFGDLKGDTWGKNEIQTKNNILIQAIGSGMKIRGRRYMESRPDLVILDDIENDENINTPEQRQKLERWFHRAVMKVGTPETDYMLIGTILHHDSLLSKILSNPGWTSKKYTAVISWSKNQIMWDEWNKLYTNIDDPLRKDTAKKYFSRNKKKMLAGTKVLWEDGLSYYYLMTKLIDEGKPSFNSEFQNDPISLEDTLFKRFMFYRTQSRTEDDGKGNIGEVLYLTPQEIGSPVRLLDCQLFGACDPSLGKSKTSDYSAILIGALSPTNRLFVLEADIERRHPSKIIEDIFKYTRMYSDLGLEFERFAVESVAFQEFFKDQVAERSMEEELYLPLSETRAAGRNKETRIESLELDITNGYIVLHERHKLLLEQLRYFPKADHDDGPDALEMLRDISRTGGFYLGSIDLSKI